MDEPAHDDRLRRLQRIAYGAVASDAERAAAVAELDALRREAVEADAAAESGADAPVPVPVRERTPTGSMRAASEWIAASDAASVRRFRWAVAAGTAALLVGIAVGWSLGTRTAPSTPSALATSAAPPESNGFTVPIADTAVPRLFDAEPAPSDVPAVASLDPRIAPADYRLLLTRSDGVTLHVARVDGDVCAVVAIPATSTASGACTHEGMFPEAGLWVEFFVQGDVGLIRGTIQPNGVAELTPAGYVPGPMPTVGG